MVCNFNSFKAFVMFVVKKLVTLLMLVENFEYAYVSLENVLDYAYVRRENFFTAPPPPPLHNIFGKNFVRLGENK